MKLPFSPNRLAIYLPLVILLVFFWAPLVFSQTPATLGGVAITLATSCLASLGAYLIQKGAPFGRVLFGFTLLITGAYSLFVYFVGCMAEMAQEPMPAAYCTVSGPGGILLLIFGFIWIGLAILTWLKRPH